MKHPVYNRAGRENKRVAHALDFFIIMSGWASF